MEGPRVGPRQERHGHRTVAQRVEGDADPVHEHDPLHQRLEEFPLGEPLAVQACEIRGVPTRIDRAQEVDCRGGIHPVAEIEQKELVATTWPASHNEIIVPHGHEDDEKGEVDPRQQKGVRRRDKDEQREAEVAQGGVDHRRWRILPSVLLLHSGTLGLKSGPVPSRLSHTARWRVSSPPGRARAVRGIYMSTVLISIWCGYIVVMTSIDEYVDVKIVLKEEEENSYT
mmetsp:Transcript_1391/g.4521  ORF Transcript_1391/g.4521 Transcript_1391/m.4521 type:complete len:228 (-) Transcript_1391:2-685(-)